MAITGSINMSGIIYTNPSTSGYIVGTGYTINDYFDPIYNNKIRPETLISRSIQNTVVPFLIVTDKKGIKTKFTTQCVSVAVGSDEVATLYYLKSGALYLDKVCKIPVIL